MASEATSDTTSDTKSRQVASSKSRQECQRAEGLASRLWVK